MRSGGTMLLAKIVLKLRSLSSVDPSAHERKTYFRSIERAHLTSSANACFTSIKLVSNAQQFADYSLYSSFDFNHLQKNCHAS